ncbi:uncharacterized protein LOC118513992 [Anopheles stephensi]|uniref:uncharacterized protein LOC118513992 n=1 Tax=Anopheles stephensi TaxID=30069 RepID=UPI0007D34E6A|nr:uncharacterized protein LOC118513992 [Anopheles stephensi]
MELQNQIYVMIAVFGGMTALLLVLTVMLAVYVKKTRTLLEDYKMTDGTHPNGMNDGDRRDRRRMDYATSAQHQGYPMDVFGQGMGPKADQTKARNDYMHNGRNINGNRHHASGPYRNDVEVGMGYMGGKRGGEKPMKPTPSHKPPRSQASVEDSALELEVANIFDMDELDEEDLSDFNSGPSGHGDGKDPRYLANGADGPAGRSKRPQTNGHQYEREMGRNGPSEGRGNRFQNPHAAMKSKGGGNGRGFAGDDGTGGKQNQGYFDDRGSMY